MKLFCDTWSFGRIQEDQREGRECESNAIDRDAYLSAKFHTNLATKDYCGYLSKIVFIL